MMVALAMNSGLVATTTSRSVSRLARDARRVIEGTVGAMDAVEVLRLIDSMQSDLESTPAAPIRVWLENLRRQVEKSR